MKKEKEYKMTQSNTDNRIKFGLDKAVLGMLLTLAWPTILENLLETILQYVDTAMVGHLGAQATATVSLTATYTWLIQSVIGALGVGFLSYIARAVGEKDQSKIRKASRLAMIVALLAGGILMAITLWMAPHVPVWMGAEKAIHADATRYFIFINLPMIFRAATIIFASAIRATGDTKTPMIVNVWVNVINIGLNYVFIYLLGKGAVGAGMATMVSYTIGGLLMTVVFLRNPSLDVLGKGGSPAQGKEGKPLVTEKAQDILPVTTRQVLTAVLAISLPVVMTRLASCLGHVVFTSFVSSMDTITYAAHAIAITAEEIFYIPGYGMMAATSTLIGHAIGEKNKKKEKDVKIVSIALIFGLMCITGILLFVGAHAMMSVFTKDPQVIAIGTRLLRMVAFTEPVFGTSAVMEGIYNGMGRTRYPLVVELISMWGVRVVGTYLCVRVFGLGITAVWIMMICNNILEAILLALGLLSMGRKNAQK